MSSPPESPESVDARSGDAPDPRRSHILTIHAEEYFHAAPLSRAVRRKHLERLESRLERNVDAALAFLEQFDAKGTFFVLGCSAERAPGAVRSIVDAGHEVASRGFWPGGVGGMTPEEYRDDLRRTHDALVACGAPAPLGYRAPRWITHRDLWVLDVLASEGYRYDSSVKPTSPAFSRDRRFHALREQDVAGDRKLWEVPVSSLRVPGRRVGISGGNYLRQLPTWLMRAGVIAWVRRRSEPLVFYFAPWELDTELPTISAVSWLDHARQYRNIPRVRDILGWYLERFPVETIATHLDLVPRDAGPARSRSLDPTASIDVRPSENTAAHHREGVSVVIPLFQEGQTVAYMRRTLSGLLDRLRRDWRVQLVLVDDASTDATFAELQRCFGGDADVKIVRHETNRGVAGAIMTGIRCADHEIVCSMDCDCSYDPSELARMIPLIRDADLVTASPYHPDGEVVNVPRWRLFLSRTLSRMYSTVLGETLHTYTSCFRVVRRSAIVGMDLRHTRFLGVAEMLIRLRLAGARIVEHPAVLEARLFGVSKMKTLATIRGHLGMLARLLLRRATLRVSSPAPASEGAELGPVELPPARTEPASVPVHDLRR